MCIRDRFTVIADILLKLLPASKQEKQAFSYYRAGLKAQTKGLYNEALNNYFLALELEEDPYDRSYIFFNMGLVFQNTGRTTDALSYLHLAIAFNENLAQAYNMIGIIYHAQAVCAYYLEDDEETGLSNSLFDKAAEYWIIALKLEPDNYPAIRNWLKTSGRLNEGD